MRLLNQARRIIIVLNCNFVNCSEATKSSEVVNPSEALNTAATVLEAISHPFQIKGFSNYHYYFSQKNLLITYNGRIIEISNWAFLS